MSTFTGTPIRRNIKTSVDLIGQLTNSYRLPGESLADFKERVLDNYVHPANSSHLGLYNGINRELGLDGHTQGILIDVERDSSGAPINPLAGVEVSSRYITLYSNHAEGTVQSQIDLHDRSGAFFLGDLTTTITNVSGWDNLLIGAGEYEKSAFLQATSSLKHFFRYRLVQSRVQNLNHLLNDGNFLTGNLSFTQEANIDTEVYSMPSGPNEFMVDYAENIVFLGKITTGTMSFQYQRFPFLLKWSPVSIDSFKDTEFMELITEQILDEDYNVIDGLPTPVGAEYVNELLSVAPMYWGE